MMIDTLLTQSELIFGGSRWDQRYLLPLASCRLFHEVHQIWRTKLSKSYERLCPGIDGLVKDLLCKSRDICQYGLNLQGLARVLGVSLRNCGCDHGDGDGELPLRQAVKGRIRVATDRSTWSQPSNWGFGRPEGSSDCRSSARLRLKLLGKELLILIVSCVWESSKVIWGNNPECHHVSLRKLRTRHLPSMHKGRVPVA